MDPIICCVLGICCPPGSPEHRESLESQLTLHFQGDSDKAKAVCDECYDDFVKAIEKIVKAAEKADKHGGA